MAKINYLVTGGCRSGKSKFALALAAPFSGRKIFLATAEALDDEMSARIENHKMDRGKDWVTVEEPLDPAAVIKREGEKSAIILLDCITLWISNLMHQDLSAEGILSKVQEFIEECGRVRSGVIVITNEVGSGIMPDNPMARMFADLTGEANQMIAKHFDGVVHMVSGIPVSIKEPKFGGISLEAISQSPHAFSEIKKQGVYDAIYRRRDIRHFKPDPVPPELLGRILDAAHHAGSVGFSEPWNFIVIDDPEVKAKVAQNFASANADAERHYAGERKELYKNLKLEGITDAPINICVTCDGERKGPHVLGRNTIPETDIYSACCAVQNLWLAARAEGLAVGWVSILSPERLKKDLEIPDHAHPVAYLCVGFTEEFYAKPMLELRGWEERTSLKELIYYNRWRGKAEGFSVTLPKNGKEDG